MASAICFNSTLVPSNHQSFIPFNTHRYFCCEFDKYHFHHATHFMYFANHLGILHKFHYISPAFCFYPHICHSVYGNTATAVAHYYHSCIPLGAHADEARNYENWFYVSVFLVDLTQRVCIDCALIGSGTPPPYAGIYHYSELYSLKWCIPATQRQAYFCA